MAKTEQLKVVQKEQKSNVNKKERLNYEILGNYSRLQTAVDKIKLRKVTLPPHQRQASQCCQMFANIMILLITLISIGTFHRPLLAYHAYNRQMSVL